MIIIIIIIIIIVGSCGQIALNVCKGENNLLCQNLAQYYILFS